MSPNGKYIAVMSLDASGGDSVANLTVIERGKTTSKSTASLSDVVPYTASFIADDRIALICTDSSYVYDLNCNQQSSRTYTSRLADFAITKGGYALLFRDNSIDSGFTLTVFGDNGSEVSTHKIDRHVSDVALQGNNAYLLLDGEVRRIDTLFGITTRAEFKGENARLVVFSGGDVMACTDTTAYYISFN